VLYEYLILRYRNDLNKALLFQCLNIPPPIGSQGIPKDTREGWIEHREVPDDDGGTAFNSVLLK
jgi:hypothetical protein